MAALVRLAPSAAESASSRELLVTDGAGLLDWGQAQVSVARSLPVELGGDLEDERESLRFGVRGPVAAMPSAFELRSLGPTGQELDFLEGVPLQEAPCPPGTAPKWICRFTGPIRAVVEQWEGRHPTLQGRALQTEVGGRWEISAGGLLLGAIPVGGPRQSELGPMGRHRVTLRIRVLRLTPGGPPAVGLDDAGAVALLQSEVTAASALWGQCGVHFGVAPDIQLVDPPSPHLLAVGCEEGFPASGGQLAFNVAGRPFRITLKPGQTPTQVARRVAGELQRAGYRAEIMGNPRTSFGALRTADVRVRSRAGGSVALGADPVLPLSTDPTLPLCLGDIDFSYGLEHFTDHSAVAGTPEERSLIRALADGDPKTIEVLVIPRFSREGRLGESFIQADGSSIRNTVILDRIAIQHRTQSFALAHELGHILLDLAGHPDDFGADTSGRLMDADASDDSLFGPRRLPLSDCVRAIRQSGPRAPVPLLREWPLERRVGAPLGKRLFEGE